jgi:hypothetical protein
VAVSILLVTIAAAAASTATAAIATAITTAATEAAAAEATAASTAAAASTTEATTTTTAAATGAIAALLGFVHAELTTVELDAVHLRDGIFRVGIGAHHDEPEAARAAGIAVEHDLHFGDLTAVGERALQGLFGGMKRQVADVKSIVHGSSASSACD